MKLIHYSSEKIQVLKQLTGRSYQIFMMLMATFAGTWATGTTPWWWSVTAGVMALILQTIASQLDYRQNQKIMCEQLEKFYGR